MEGVVCVEIGRHYRKNSATDERFFEVLFIIEHEEKTCLIVLYKVLKQGRRTEEPFFWCDFEEFKNTFDYA